MLTPRGEGGGRNERALRGIRRGKERRGEEERGVVVLGPRKVVPGTLTLAEVVLDAVSLSMSLAWGSRRCWSIADAVSVGFEIVLVGQMAPIIPTEEETMPE